MWLGPVLFVGVSIFLWKYVGAVFVPELLARSVFRMLPPLESIDLFVMINAALLYFGGYFEIAIFWKSVKAYLRNPFIAALALWLVNVLIVFRLLGRCMHGYRLPEGLMAANVLVVFSPCKFGGRLRVA